MYDDHGRLQAPPCKIIDFLPVRALTVIHPLMAVSSRYFTALFSPCLGLQSWVYSVNRRGLSAEPWEGVAGGL